MKPEHEENYRPHAITHTCRASRDVIWQGLLLREAKRPYIFCDSKHDTILLRNDGSNFKEFCKKVSSYELNRQRNNRINGCNCRGIAVMCVQCILRTDDNVK
jgi:hypothetical protein